MLEDLGHPTDTSPAVSSVGMRIWMTFVINEDDDVDSDDDGDDAEDTK